MPSAWRKGQDMTVPIRKPAPYRGECSIEGCERPRHARLKSRLGSAGALLRTGVDGARRSVKVVCCDSCREAVIAEFDGAIGATIEAVARALKGE